LKVIASHMAKTKPTVKEARAPLQTEAVGQGPQPRLPRSRLAEPHIATFRLRVGSYLDAEARVEVSTIGLLAVTGLVTGVLLSVVPIIRAAKSR
jgi:hypothetical protein